MSSCGENLDNGGEADFQLTIYCSQYIKNWPFHECWIFMKTQYAYKSIGASFNKYIYSIKWEYRCKNQLTLLWKERGYNQMHSDNTQQANWQTQEHPFTHKEVLMYKNTILNTYKYI